MDKTRDLAIDAFPRFCREHGLKCTAQRMAVFAVVHASHTHPSVDEAWEKVKQSIPTITRDSTYRILNEFSALGLLVRMDALSSARYDTIVGPHAHFICEKCGKITDYPMPEGLAIPSGMPAERHHLELRVTGLCDRCRNKSPKE